MLGSQAKGLILGMLLVPEDSPPCTVVLSRDGGLLDVASQLPESPDILLRISNFALKESRAY